MPIVTTIFFFVWTAAILVGIWALRIAQVFGNRMPRVAKRKLDPMSLPVAVILPIKGVDVDTAENLQALLQQDYPNYRLIFAVENAQDPAVALIREVTRTCKLRVDIVVAGLATARGQKIHNQLAAVEQTNADDEVLIFMDADARPAPDWIHALVVPLTYGPHIGATTGYRYYIPVPGENGGSNKSGANAIASVINAGVAALFGPYRRTFAWGGSMAVRRQDFFDYGIARAWQHALSDDYVLAHVVKKEKQVKIHFVPQCVVASQADFSWGNFFEFAIRQYRITRICAPWVWLAAFTGPILLLASLGYSLLFTIIRTIYPPVNRPYEAAILGLMFGSLYGMYVVRGWLLARGVCRLLPAHAPAIRATRGWFSWGYPLVQVVNFTALLGSAFGRRIVWRGVTYIMHSRTQTTVLRPEFPSGQIAQQPELSSATH